MIDRELEITVHGIPVPQGSKTYLGHGRMVEAGGQKLKNWRHDVTRAAQQAHTEHGAFIGPIYVEIDFYLPRPRSHYGTGRNADKVRDSSPAYPSSRPDLDKLIRAVDDALTASGIWVDDAQVVGLYARKLYANPDREPGADIVIAPLYRTVGAASSATGVPTTNSVQEDLPL